MPFLGSFHESDLILNMYAGGDLTDFLVQFATHLNPNGLSKPQWPRYTPSSPKLMTLLDSQITNRTITLDTYRVKGMKFLTNLSLGLIYTHPEKESDHGFTQIVDFVAQQR